MLFDDGIFEFKSYFYDQAEGEKHPVYIDWVEEYIDGTADYSPLITYKAGNLKPEILRELAGEITLAIMNHEIDFFDQNQFNFPYFENENCFNRYEYDPIKGFSKNKCSPREWWVENLFSKAVELILAKKASICPVCGLPFLRIENRGRYSRSTCSASCKTKLSQQRKTKAVSNALSGIPIETTIESLGEQYRGSIVRWYKGVNKSIV